MTPRKTPLQEAERNRCVGGRAAWMPREARRAMDGPSRRAPGATMEGGKFGAAKPGCWGKFFASFSTIGKGSRPGGRNKTHRPRGNELSNKKPHQIANR